MTISNVKLAFAFLLASIVLLAPCVQAGGFSEFVLLDCQGNMNGLATFAAIDVQVTGPILQAGYSAFIDALYNRAQCGCSSIGVNDFKRLLAPTFDFVLNTFDGPQGDISMSGCSLSSFSNSAIKGFYTNSSGNFPASKFKVTMPSTCTYANWRDNGVCGIKFPATPFDVELGLLVKKCPSSHLPFVSITCDGSGCDKIGKPCTSSSDCTTTNNKLSCKQLNFDIDNITRAVPNAEDIFDMFTSMDCYDNGDASPGCYDSATFVTSMVKKIRDAFDGNGASLPTAVSPSFCMPSAFGNDGQEIFDLMGFNNIIFQNHTDTFNRTVIDSIDMVTNGVITSWNGIRADGSDAGSSNRMNGVSFPAQNQIPNPITSGATVLGYINCNGEIWAAPRSAAGMYMGFSGVADLLNTGYANIRPQQDCRASGRSGSISDDAFRIRFGGLPDMVIQPFTTPVPSVAMGPMMSDWKINVSSYPNKLSMPTTATYAEVQSTGEASATFSGLQSLLGVDLRVNVFAKRCPGFELGAEVYAECVGDGCQIFNGGFKPCTSNTECGGTLTCRSMQNIVEAWKFGSSSNSYSLDLIGQMLYGSGENICRSNSKLYEDLRYIAARALGLNPTSPGTSPSSFCFFDTDHIYNVVSTWGEGQSSTSGNTVTVKDLLAWNNPTSTVTTSAGTIGAVTGINTQTPSSASQVVMSAIVAFAVVMLALVF